MNETQKKHDKMVTEVVLHNVLLESANYQKLHDGIKQKFNVDIPVEELKKMYSVYQLFQKIQKEKQM